ncbi:MAG: orotate phosphoribosyltransferase [Acidobacteria bacterium]|nr:MAG: orotate phosphoribosyltransferase [Acidobacteriota bacterium]
MDSEKAKQITVEESILEIFRKDSALLEGHFILSSGLHSDRYIQSALVLQQPRLAEFLGMKLARKLEQLKPKVVAAPALGGVIVAHEVARALGPSVRAVFTERDKGVMTLRRGFRFGPGEPTIVVEDVITTGGSTIETIATVEQAGARVLGVGALVDRSGGKAEFHLPKAALITLEVQNYDPANCPLCKAGIPAVKPGSRYEK